MHMYLTYTQDMGTFHYAQKRHYSTVSAPHTAFRSQLPQKQGPSDVTLLHSA